MSKNILVIGGTRFVGKLLVQRLLRAGHRVTIATRGYAPDPFGERIARIRVDRRNELAMRRAFAACAPFDVVFDQMCYNPLDAAIAVRTLAGKAGRYIMTSTIDAYRVLGYGHGGLLAEDDLAVEAQAIDTAYPWHDPRRATECYVAGKVQAEAYLVRDGSLPLATVRLAHVLAGPEDFTGRLAHYVDLARRGGTLDYTAAGAQLSFIDPHAAADVLFWTGMQSFGGAVNAASDGALSALDLYRRVADVLETPAQVRRAAAGAAAGALSPFDLPARMVLDTSRAKGLGYRFGQCEDWIDHTIRQHDLAFI
ncbi:NAD-dependent epimerase/dehydratase family protein [Herbaspirillum sp. SJZ107]|uniref:NAD-dependent epimerase/dehydratase family protein n=1 Tax=Herbaspirillum sp. SJZ107 TaxID=2572881 RepID=UPI0011509605|nr:NAD-dependent epimerase/dehydratase family protein [Herbaspirillum sp. SJZ107]TQK11242.1 nucleoside-diphosphate-sugar epimerase [Herbaspirillum sp. SJZ107]